MPWGRTDVSEQRIKFVVRAASGKERMASLCREFGVSRPTGYRWRRRFQQAGSMTGVVERSRRPLRVFNPVESLFSIPSAARDPYSLNECRH